MIEKANELREKEKLTKSETASLLYTHYGSWRNWELGKHDMPKGYYNLLKLKLSGKKARVPDKPTERRVVLNALIEGMPISKIIAITHVAPRTLRAWRSGQRNIPSAMLELIILWARGLADKGNAVSAAEGGSTE
jgi:DNA-binding transcriptional regulator YiaG